jgi:hypothetical protein
VITHKNQPAKQIVRRIFAVFGFGIHSIIFDSFNVQAESRHFRRLAASSAVTLVRA